MSEYPPQPSQYPAPKQGMSTGKKIALGCSIPVLGLVLLAACGAMIGPADKKDEKPETKPAAAKPTRAAPTPSGGDIPAWVTAMEGAGVKFEDKGATFTARRPRGLQGLEGHEPPRQRARPLPQGHSGHLRQ
ncbi:hypothetical protein OG625_27165 [Streptomyces sp. NBC_01351]|uniref:hypothetical protein n=1 Tax=Streptomyces sp. NBC_01351 TaxID=2903833 RepID=UPI002E31C21C|nr:hypothetical protein [Streptomyces sp. NBC_01351]